MARGPEQLIDQPSEADGRTLLESIQEQNMTTAIEGIVWLGKVIETLIPYPEGLLAVAQYLQSWSLEKLMQAMGQTDEAAEENDLMTLESRKTATGSY